MHIILSDLITCNSQYLFYSIWKKTTWKFYYFCWWFRSQQKIWLR